VVDVDEVKGEELTRPRCLVTKTFTPLSMRKEGSRYVEGDRGEIN
jgi:hypothetical protein